MPVQKERAELEYFGLRPNIVKYTFLLSLLLGLVACGGTQSSSSSQMIKQNALATPVKAAKAEIQVDSIQTAAGPMEAAQRPQVQVDEFLTPADLQAAGLMVASTEAQSASLEVAPVASAEPISSFTGEINLVSADNSQSPLFIVSQTGDLRSESAINGQGGEVLACAEPEPGVIDRLGCTKGLVGQALVTSQAGGTLLAANGLSPNGDDELSEPVPMGIVTVYAPSAGLAEMAPNPEMVSVKVGQTQSLLIAAYQQAGRPYKAGGQNPEDGFDAPGFARWVYSQKGLRLPQDVKSLVNAGKLVDKENLRPGDLLVYSDESGKAQGYHVGIYTGQGNFLHAAAKSGVVTETAAFGPQYSPYFVGGRRIYDDPKAAPLTDSQKVAATSNAVKLALSELGPNDKLQRPKVVAKKSKKKK